MGRTLFIHVSVDAYVPLTEPGRVQAYHGEVQFREVSSGRHNQQQAPCMED